jgi:hypothetical protein
MRVARNHTASTAAFQGTCLAPSGGVVVPYKRFTDRTRFDAIVIGSGYCLTHSPDRFLTRDLRPRTPIEDLFLTGQDVATCGVVGALSGAVTTVSAMLGRNLFSVPGHGI